MVEVAPCAGTFKFKSAILFTGSQQPWESIESGFSPERPIPSMMCVHELRFLHYIAKHHYTGRGAVVDFGPLVGSSTYALASGMSRGRIFSYDRWQMWHGLDPAYTEGKQLEFGDDLLPFFLKNTAPFAAMITPRKGNITEFTWRDGPIEIMLIDAAKKPAVMRHIANEFFPHLVPGAIVIQQDYVTAECPWLHICMVRMKEFFELIDSPEGGSVCFRVRKPIPANFLPDKFWIEEDARACMAEARSELTEWRALCMWLAEARYETIWGQPDRAAEITRLVQQHPDFVPEMVYDVRLIEESPIEPPVALPRWGMYNHVHYQGKYWAVPSEIGNINITREKDQKKPGVLVADTLRELRALCGPPYGPPKTLAPYGMYNRVKYRGKYWAIPLKLKSLNITEERNRQAPGVLMADTMPELKALCRLYGPPRVAELYGTYNLVKYLGRFWAVPMELGALDLTKEQNQTEPGILVADTIDQLKLLCGPPIKPSKLLETYGMYNLVKYAGRCWAVPILLGHLEISRERDRQQPGILVADTIEEMKAMLGPPVDLPMLLERYGRYNFVKFGKYWALPMPLGNVDLLVEEDRRKPGILIADSLEELKALCGPPVEMPMLVERCEKHSLVSYLKKYWAIPLALGDVDLEEERDRQKPGILVADSLEQLKTLCEAS